MDPLLASIGSLYERAFALVNLAKEKPGMAIAGLAVPPVASAT